MRTTFDLPDDLMRRLKVYAADRGVKMRDVVAESIEKQLQYTEGRVPRSPLPSFPKAAANGRVIPNRSNAELEAILDES